ncbi:glycosyltransferase family 4 protein [Devosia sp. 2618]|uniref:glycosyltransferase family 4 protein n=1 Tax=Devosia sp. 2618 TaxID=3156454 RepID=UPI00339ADC3E
MSKMILHDYGGHPFTGQLARALAARGNAMVYAWFAGFSGPKGRMGGVEHAGFRAVPLDIGGPFDKDNLVRRGLQQREYARVVAALVLQERPDEVLSANAPIEVQEALQRACARVGARFVFWLQDIHSEAIGRIIGKKNDGLGKLAGTYFRARERRVLQASDAVIAIADAFLDVLGGEPWRMDTAGMEVIENWAPLEDIPLLPRDNDWAQANLRPAQKRIVYTGTLARKHNPDLLLYLARNLEADVYLFSEGSSADHVSAVAASEGLDNMIVRPWVDVDDLPSVLASADILYAVIEEDAGVFSVPSKVLSYLAAGRAILGSIPTNNLAAQTICRAEAGRVVAPDDVDGLLRDARALLGDDAARAEMASNARAYAERTFHIANIAGRFEDVLNERVGQTKLAAE